MDTFGDTLGVSSWWDSELSVSWAPGAVLGVGLDLWETLGLERPMSPDVTCTAEA